MVEIRQWSKIGCVGINIHKIYYFADSHNAQADKVQRTAARCGPAGDGEIQVVSVICWTSLSGHPWKRVGSSPS